MQNDYALKNTSTNNANLSNKSNINANNIIEEKPLSTVQIVYSKNISFNGKTFEKTYFSRIPSTSISGSKDFATVTQNSDGTSLVQNSVFAPNTTTLIDGFYLGAFEVTQELYSAVISACKNSAQENDAVKLCAMLNNEPSYFENNAQKNEVQRLRPVEQITWYDAIIFCNALSFLCGYDACYTINNAQFAKVDVTNGAQTQSAQNNTCVFANVLIDTSKNGFRLPTEAEWECAARATDVNARDWFYTYSGAMQSDSVAWFLEKQIVVDEDILRVGKTHEVGLKKPNTLGLFDMNGNVQEWCFDDFAHINIFDVNKKTHHKNPLVIAGNVTTLNDARNLQNVELSTKKVARGGSWFRTSAEGTVTFRLALDASKQNTGCGIRLARTPYQDESF